MDVFLHFLNRVIEPVINLKSEDEVVEFFSTADSSLYKGDLSGPLFKKATSDKIPPLEAYESLRLKTRVICFYYDKDDYKDEIKQFRMDARKLSTRSNLRIGLVTDRKVIKALKKHKSSSRYFANGSLSSCALRRYDNTYIIFDISGSNEVIDFYSWVQ